MKGVLQTQQLTHEVGENWTQEGAGETHNSFLILSLTLSGK